MSNKRGRPQKHTIQYEGSQSRLNDFFKEYISCVADSFGQPYDDRIPRADKEPSLREVCGEFHISIPKARKLLITANVYSTELSRRIMELSAMGMDLEEIMERTGLSRSSVGSYLPYKKFSYNMEDTSRYAEDSRKYRERKKRVKELQEKIFQEKKGIISEEETDAALWRTVIAYQGYPFHTISGLPFTYSLKLGRNGGFTKELFVTRMENSKSLAWSSVRIAFEKAKEKEGVVARPKELGDIRGVSYVYSLLWRFGVIEVPEKCAYKMRGRGYAAPAEK